MFQNIFSSTNNETYEFALIPRVKNSSYEYDTSKKVIFRGRPANTQEKSKYRLQLGVNTTADSVYIYETNLPEDIKPGDKVKYLGMTQVVESVGYYYDLNGIVNASKFSDEYVIARCPKGITLSKA